MPRVPFAARWRLVCLPHAGGGASAYHGWRAPLQEAGIEVRAVQYPGRESRFSEPPILDAHAMAAALAERWDEIGGSGPCALYGHSMGALLAFELMVELERRGAAHRPSRLFVSGHQAPDLPYRPPRVHALPEAELLGSINRHFGGIPKELLEDRDIAELIATTLRADFTLVENYAWRGAGPISVPIFAMGGTEDPWTTREELEAWARHTRAGFEMRMIPGDHFFNVSARAEVLGEIVRRLE